MSDQAAVHVKNKAPAPIQITAEQILREAVEKQDSEPKTSSVHISDRSELNEFRKLKRTNFENAIKMQKMLMGNYTKYAKWEESQGEIERARSVYERALEVDYRNVTIWLKYAEMEMKHKNVNHARNIWDRCVKLLPRIDQLWYKYAYMEEILGNVKGARDVYERWMKWEPDENAWLTYLRFETKYGTKDTCRNVWTRYVQSSGKVDSYMKYAKWEEKQNELKNSRKIYEIIFDVFPENEIDEDVYIKFAKFEVRCHEYERARAIYKLALEKIGKDKNENIYREYTSFEKKYGDRKDIEDVVLDKRRNQYEEEIKSNPNNYDVWFDYIKLEESVDNNKDKIREIYERAISVVPQYKEKKFWRRYIYLWINYAIFEELETKEMKRCRAIYKKCLEIIPNKKFTFAKIWILYAKFEIRQRNLDQARKILGTAIGKCPKPRLFKAYIQLELTLGEINRCRKLYNKFLEFAPHSCYGWNKYAEMEISLQEYERGRKIYELAISQPLLDMPEILWKKYIDFEIRQKEYDKVRELFESLLEKSQNVKVYITYAQFENDIKETQKARDIFIKGDKYFKDSGMREERALLMKAWKGFESSLGSENEENIQKVIDKMPRKEKKTRDVYDEDGNVCGNEEYYDYIFGDEIGSGSNSNEGSKLLRMSKQWKINKSKENN